MVHALGVAATSNLIGYYHGILQLFTAWIAFRRLGTGLGTIETRMTMSQVIMGGRSSSQLSCDSAGRLVFSGVINTNGGGFAALRTSEQTQVSIPKDAAFVKVSHRRWRQCWLTGPALALLRRARA